jgi:PAS domain S-box-containing protein
METAAIYRAVAENAPVLIWIADSDQRRTYVNGRWLDFTGRPAESELGSGWMENIHPEDLQHCREIYSSSFAARREFRLEYRLRRSDGEFRWVWDTGVPFSHAAGSFDGYIGSCVDISEKVSALITITQSNARLLEGQEQERTRIARELHDDIGSALAILGIEMLRAGQSVSGSPGARHPGIPEIYNKVQDISSRISRLSHRLHSAALEYFGLAKAVGSECRTFSETHHIPVSCACRDVPPKINPFIARSLLRVVQESLRNAAKHSRATAIAVEVWADASAITLQVSDNGVGFDVDQSRLAAGLGLIGMRERMRMIGGVFEIQSESGTGTKIACSAPLNPARRHTEPT